MNDYYQGFKSDFIKAANKLVRRTWVKISLIYAITSIIMTVIATDFIFSMVGINVDYFANAFDPRTITDSFENVLREIMSPSFILGITIITILSVIIQAWIYNLYFLVVRSETEGAAEDIQTTLNKSFSNNVLKIIGVILLMYAALLVGLLVIALIGKLIGVLFIFIGLIVLLAIIFKLILTIPAITLGDMSALEAFTFSWNKIAWKTAFKYLGIAFVAGIALMIVFVIVGAILSIFSFIPLIGTAVQFIAGVAIGAIITTCSIAILTGLYYRNIESQQVNNVS